MISETLDPTHEPLRVPSQEELVDERLVQWYFLAAIAFMGVAMLAGLLVALQLAEYFGCTVDELFQLQPETTLDPCCTDVLPNGHHNEH